MGIIYSHALFLSFKIGEFQMGKEGHIKKPSLMVQVLIGAIIG